MGFKNGIVAWGFACVFLATLCFGEMRVETWLTTESLSSALERRDDVFFGDEGQGIDLVVEIDPEVRFQEIDGWGVSLTGASSWLLTERLSEARREQVMESLFGSSGIGLSMLRQTMGASDFDRSTYSYNDGEEDPALTRFSIDRDREYILPRVREALSINPRIKVMASPWSPPGWMKSSGDLIGGTLLNAHYQTNANYFVKFIDAYQSEGIPIYAVTPQNEPGYSPPHYPGMILTRDQQIRFIGDFLGPTLEEAGLGRVKIICHDHNYDGLDIPLAILASPASEYVEGSGFHHYGGPIQAMSSLNSQFPEKGIWFTEGGFGEWNDHFDNIVHEMIEIPRNWAKAIVLWNAALDQNSGPSVIGDDNPNEGMLLIRSDEMDAVSYNGQFYFLGHLSKFVRPGAVRVASPSWIGDVETVAFENLDGSVALVLANRNQNARRVRVNWQGESFVYEVPRRCMMTFRWGGGSANAPFMTDVSFQFGGGSPGFTFDLDTSVHGPMFNVEKSDTLNGEDWRYLLPEIVGEDSGVETWLVDASEAVGRSFLRVNVWP